MKFRTDQPFNAPEVKPATIFRCAGIFDCLPGRHKIAPGFNASKIYPVVAGTSALKVIDVPHFYPIQDIPAFEFALYR